MKKILILVSLCILGTAMTSCDENKKLVKETALSFITAVNERDTTTVKQIYPLMKYYKDYIIFPDTVVASSIKVKYDKRDNLYDVRLNKDNQYLTMRVESGSAKIAGTENVFSLIPEAVDLAKAIGIPVNNLNDLGPLNELMRGTLMYELKRQCPSALTGNLIIKNTSYFDRYWESAIDAKVTVANTGTETVEGEDYMVIIGFWRLWVNKMIFPVSEPGVTLEPGQTHTFVVRRYDLYDYALTSDLEVRAEVEFIDANDVKMLGKYGTFDGTEYETFKANQ